jgi:hypothetical protein
MSGIFPSAEPQSRLMRTESTRYRCQLRQYERALDATQEDTPRILAHSASPRLQSPTSTADSQSQLKTLSPSRSATCSDERV